MSTTEFGTYHIASSPKQYQPIRTNNFRCLVYGLEGLLRAGSEDDVIRNAREVIDFSVVSFDPPKFSQNPLKVERGNSTVNYAGKASFNQSNLVINDFAGADGKSILKAWQALSYDVENDTIPSSDVYKKDAVILEYLPDNTLVNVYNLYGCWVSDLNETGWNNESSEKKVVTAQITYDRCVSKKA